jgi:hypothetical protein
VNSFVKFCSAGSSPRFAKSARGAGKCPLHQWLINL